MANKPAISTVISSRAQKEIAESWAWYEDRFAGLGDRFLNEIVDHLRQIELNPDRFPTRFKSYKEAPIKTFPFLVIYRVSKRANLIRVVSVFHTARNPKKKYTS
jgi:plasmid stabilization system protein ParE